MYIDNVLLVHLVLFHHIENLEKVTETILFHGNLGYVIPDKKQYFAVKRIVSRISR